MIKNRYDLVVIGAGPAGMMAAVRAAECGAAVLLLEKNSTPGIKLLMTGKERCNITNDERDPRRFAAAYGKNGKFLLSALYNFGVEGTVEFFEKGSVKTKVERGGRIFPESDQAKEVQELFLRRLKYHGVKLKTGCRIKKICSTGRSIEKVVLHDGEVNAENYLISTGGLSYPHSGSTGDGYRWAEQLGHTIIKPGPALTPLTVKERWVKELEGLSLRNVRISLFQDNKKQDDRFGEALFTDTGMSGPIILDMSKSAGSLLNRGRVELKIDFKPALDFSLLDRRIVRDFDAYKNKTINNTLPGLMPKKLIPVVLRLAHIDPDRKCHSITKDDRKRLRLLLKEFPLNVKSLVGFKKAVITAGGVNLKEVDPKTMQSRLIDNLYFAGEILDLDGPTGGYNLQVCWSTGYLAGESAAPKKG